MEKLTFEDAIENLEKIVSELEAGNLSLDDSVKKFEDGMKLSKNCQKMLENAEKKVNVLIADANGQMHEEPFLQN